MFSFFRTVFENDSEIVGCPSVLKTFDLRMTIVLIGISWSFLCLPTSQMVVNILYNYFQFFSSCKDFVYSLTFHLSQLHFASNSFFYFFLASDCRKELKKFVCTNKFSCKWLTIQLVFYLIVYFLKIRYKSSLKKVKSVKAILVSTCHLACGITGLHQFSPGYMFNPDCIIASE